MCGLHKGYETNDKDSSRKMYPWLASITVRVSVQQLFHSSERTWVYLHGSLDL